MFHVNRVYGLQLGASKPSAKPNNRITEFLAPAPRGWIASWLFGSGPETHEPSCLCEECWKLSFHRTGWREFEGEECLDCGRPLHKCRCGGGE